MTVCDGQASSAGLLLPLLSLSLLTLCACAASSTTDPVPAACRDAATAVDQRSFDLQGHRGARGLAPENTIAGIDAALTVGVDTLELDTAIARDGVVVLSHDRLLAPDITRDAAGNWLSQPGPPIRALDFAQLQQYDVGRIRPGSSHAEQFPRQVPVDGSRIPSLAQVFEHVAARGDERVRFNLEIKSTPLAPDETVAPDVFAAALTAVIRQHRMSGRSTIQSFDWRALQAVQRIAPDIPTIYLTSQRLRFDTVRLRSPHGSPWTAPLIAARYASVPRTVAAAGGGAWSPSYRDLASSSVRDARALGLRVIPWTVNEPTAMRRLLDWGVDGIITDRPDLLRQVMAERGMPLPPPSPPLPRPH